jgi:hypothetical protein
MSPFAEGVKSRLSTAVAEQLKQCLDSGLRGACSMRRNTPWRRQERE